MSSDTYSREVQQILRDLEQLQRQLESASRTESQAAQRLHQAQKSFDSASEPFKNLRRGEVSRASQAHLDAQRRTADFTQKIAAKNAALHRAQGNLLRASQEEAKKRAAEEQRLKREQDARERLLRTELATARVAATAPPASTASAPPDKEYDLFICHASEDKEDLVRALAERLRELGLNVWYDEFVLRVGDSLRRKIDEGLAKCRFGVVVLSTAFFAKNWAQYELDGLVAIENAGRAKVILPVWHRVTKDEVMSRSPTLGDRVALNTSVHSLDHIAEELAAVCRDAA
jgi:chemotaxis protein histidine kinase CheA